MVKLKLSEKCKLKDITLHLLAWQKLQSWMIPSVTKEVRIQEPSHAIDGNAQIGGQSNLIFIYPVT